MYQVLHLLVFDHDEVLDLLRELFESINEVCCLVCVLYLLKIGHLLLADTRDYTVFKLRVQREHALL